MDIQNQEQKWMKFLKGLENEEFEIRSKKRRADQESSASVYYEYPAAGSIEGAEFFHAEDDASGAAAL